MKIITEPSVYLVGRQSINHRELQRFLTDIGRPEWETDAPSAAEMLVETGGRLCYRFAPPRPGGNAAYIANILDHKHGSVTEHAVWTIVITGISRSLSHELITHRAGVSKSQESQRYVDCADVAFVVPPARLKEHAAWERWCAYRGNGGTNLDDHPDYEAADAFAEWVMTRRNELTTYAKDTQRFAADAPPELTGTDRRKWARQAARDGLPNCTETRIQLTVNARAIRTILEQRGSRHADAEIRRLANLLLDVFQREAPNLFGDYDRFPLPDGTFEILTPYSKV
jgi:thymidylate synthase (FAD)